MDGQFFCNGTCVPGKLQVRTRLTAKNPPIEVRDKVEQVVHSRASRFGFSMQNGKHSYKRVRFGVFEMDFETGELRKHGMQVRLQKQPFQVLTVLLEHAGEVVSREELQKELWAADTFVDFDHGLNKAINKIREALGDSAESPRFLETVSRRGYRFLAEVKDVDAGSAAVPRPPTEVPGSQKSDLIFNKAPSRAASRKTFGLALTWTRLGAVLTLVLLIAVAGALLYFRNGPSSSLIRYLAVLPLESL